MKDEAEDEAGCRAREFLPCHCTVKAGDYHTVDCPANYREDIAAALRKAQAERDELNEELERCCTELGDAGILITQGPRDGITKLINQIEQRDAEIAKLKELNSAYYDDRYEQAQQINKFKAKLEQKQLEWLGMKSEIQVCHQKLEQLKAERDKWLAWSGGQYPDDSPGDVIHADADGSIILDDGITTWNPARALMYFKFERDAAYVRGLERAKALATDELLGWAVRNAIAAEIEKARK